MAPMSVQITPTGSRYFLLIDMLLQTYLPTTRASRASFFFRATGEEQITKKRQLSWFRSRAGFPTHSGACFAHDAYQHAISRPLRKRYAANFAKHIRRPSFFIDTEHSVKTIDPRRTRRRSNKPF